MVIASCPVCGKVLFRGSPQSKIEGSCPKCGEYLTVTYFENGFNAIAANYTGESYTSFKQSKTEKKNITIS